MVTAAPRGTHVVRFGMFELDLGARELRAGPTKVTLQPQPFEILCTVLEQAGEVVTRQQLQRRLWPEGTFVDFEHSLNAAVKRLRAALGDDADHPRFIETLARRGYRFIGPLRPGAPLLQTDRSANTGRPGVRLAVLAFTSRTREDDLSSGLVEEVIAQVGRQSRGRISVIARMSSMVFKGSARRAREVGESLQAAYLLEGSVRRHDNRVRITAWLVEAAGEAHVWSDTYECRLSDALSIQAEVGARIAASLVDALGVLGC